MARLNYSKWDAIELSDDSDVEVHPNVDKKSFIRWKQRDIHEKRDARKHKIVQLKSEIEMNQTLEPRMDTYMSGLKAEGLPYIERLSSEMKGKNSQERPSNSNGPTYDEMMLSLFQQIAQEVKSEEDVEARTNKLLEKLAWHKQNMINRSKECEKELAAEEAEQKKHITAEDMHDGFDTGYVTKDGASKQPIEKPRPKPSTTKSIEVLNPSAPKDSSSSEEDIPDLTPTATAFAKIPIDKWDQLFKAISQAPELLTEETTDALLMEAFTAAGKGQEKFAKQCVHQALIIQYSAKLGRDGVALFFKRMAGQHKGREVFENDVQNTYERISKRSKELAAERATQGEPEGQETIQLVASEPGTVIGFDVPDGPAPEHLTIEGEGSEDVDVEQVRVFLDERWKIFEGLPKNLKAALKKGELESVNKVLGRMAVDEAEEVVGLLDQARILSFSSSEIVDETGRDKANA